MKVYLYILDTLADWEIGYLTAELNSKRFFKSKDIDLDIIKISGTETLITTMGGMQIKPDMLLDSIEFSSDDLLILPGADLWDMEEHQRILNIAKQRIENDLRVAAICGATIGLAKIGALNQKKHTSNNKDYLVNVCPNYNGIEKYIELPAFSDSNLITASSLGAIEFTYEIIKMLNVFNNRTLDAWLNLFSKREDRYYFDLMDSLS